jgi:integrase
MATSNPRPRGTGQLYEREDAQGQRTWYGRWHDGAGRRPKRRIGLVKTRGTPGLTRREAEARLRELISTSTMAGPQLGERVDVVVAAERYVEHLRRRGRKRATVQNVESEMRVHIVPAFAGRTVSSIEPEDVQNLVGILQARKLAPKTIRNVVATLSALLRFSTAPARRWATHNVAVGVELPDVPEAEEVRFLTLDELDLLLANVPAGTFRDIDRAMWLTAAQSGLRRGELLALRWSDVDWLASRIRVRRSWVRGEFGTPKSRRYTRSVPMSRGVALALEALSRATEFAGDDDLVFGHPVSGEPLYLAGVGRRFANALTAAKLAPHRFHDLRHTFGTTMAAAGVPMRTLQEWMGHRDIATTQRYADYAPGLEDATLVEGAFGRGPERAREPVVGPKSANLREPQDT